MLKSIMTRFPIFSSDLCKTFNNRIPAYIFKEVVKYCNSTPNPTINKFLETIPSYYIKNSLENYNHGFYYDCDINNENNKK